MINLSFILAIDDKFLWFNGLINHAGSMLVDHEKNSQLTSCNNFFYARRRTLQKTAVWKYFFHFQTVLLYYAITRFFADVSSIFYTSLPYYAITWVCSSQSYWVITLLRCYTILLPLTVFTYYAITRFFADVSSIFLLPYYLITLPYYTDVSFTWLCSLQTVHTLLPCYAPMQK